MGTIGTILGIVFVIGSFFGLYKATGSFLVACFGTAALCGVAILVGVMMSKGNKEDSAAKKGDLNKRAAESLDAEGQLYEYEGYIGRTPMEAILASEDDHDTCMYCGCYTGGASDVCPECLDKIQNGGL